jgi:hypothetical protein
MSSWRILTISDNSQTAVTQTPSPQAPTTEDLSFLDHVIADIAPRREVHLFGGPSGAGKTTFLIKLLESWAKGAPVFGHQSHPEPFLYISGDRSLADMKRTMRRLKITNFPIHIPPTNAVTIAQVMEDALRKYPKTRLLVVEGLATWVPDGKLSDYRVVADFLRKIGDFCHSHDLTVIGVVHSPKRGEKDRYTNPRERIMGSTAWGAYSNLIMFVEPVDPDSKDNRARELYILPRNAPEEKYTLDWKDGMLIPVTVKMKPTNAQRVLEWIGTVPADSMNGERLFTTAEALQGTGLSERSLFFELDRLKKNGLLENIKQGRYKILRTSEA